MTHFCYDRSVIKQRESAQQKRNSMTTLWGLVKRWRDDGFKCRCCGGGRPRRKDVNYPVVHAECLRGLQLPGAMVKKMVKVFRECAQRISLSRPPIPPPWVPPRCSV